MGLMRGGRGNNDCGPTCVSNALNQLGYAITIKKANQICGLKAEGTYTEDLIRAFKKYGFDAKERVFSDPEVAWGWLMRETKKGILPILGVDNDTHWTLILRAGEKQVQIFDPMDELPAKTNKEDFLARWKYQDCSGKNQYLGISFKPTRNKSLRAVELRKALLGTADVK